MTHLPAKPWTTGRLSGGRRLVALIAALGLLLQSYVVQTHMHLASLEAGEAFQAAGHSAAPGQSPFDRAMGCPLCQAVVHAGVFVAPSAPLIYLCVGWVGSARAAFVWHTASDPVAHSWRSRAPPLG